MYWLPIALMLLAALQGTAETRSIAIGGASGSSWQDGGGQIQAIFPTGPERSKRQHPGRRDRFRSRGSDGLDFSAEHRRRHQSSARHTRARRFGHLADGSRSGH